MAFYENGGFTFRTLMLTMTSQHLTIGDLIRFNDSMRALTRYELGGHTTLINNGQVGLLVDDNKRNSRFKVLLNDGRMCEVTQLDLERHKLSILAKANNF